MAAVAMHHFSGPSAPFVRSKGTVSGGVFIYPEGFEKYHFKAAIPARNRYLVDNAAYALCYVTHGWGGAAQTLERAQKKGLTIINLGERNNGRDNL